MAFLSSPLFSNGARDEHNAARRSTHGEPKYGADFRIRLGEPRRAERRHTCQWADGTFDTLNPFSDKGVKAVG